MTSSDPKRKVPITPPRLEDNVTQPTLFDAPAGVEARDKAISRVERNADPRWLTHAHTAIEALCRLRREFTTDDVWEYLAAHQLDRPDEPRALGAIMRSAAHAGLIVATDRYVNSERPECHARPVKVWRAI